MQLKSLEKPINCIIGALDRDLSSGYCHPPFEQLGQAHFFFYSFPVTLPVSFPFSILVLVPIPVSICDFGFLLFQTPLVEILSLLDCFV